MDDYFDVVLRLADEVGRDWILVDSHGVVLAARRAGRILISDAGRQAESEWVSYAERHLVDPAPVFIDQDLFQQDFR